MRLCGRSVSMETCSILAALDRIGVAYSIGFRADVSDQHLSSDDIIQHDLRAKALILIGDGFAEQSLFKSSKMIKTGEQSSRVLSAEGCADERALRRFIEEHISVNAWPILSPKLRRLICLQGIDLDAAERFTMPLSAMAEMMSLIYRRAVRVEHLLGIENAFHTPAHNVEVLLRLLCLEWPPGKPMPELVRTAPLKVYTTIGALHAAAMNMLAALLGAGVSCAVLVRDLLAALGHDYCHSGGTDRLLYDGTPAPLTHEEVAERCVGNIGVRLGFPAALILQSMAGIRATTFNSRPGKRTVVPANDFERKIALADVMGCVLPSPEWLTHVGVPVLREKIPCWKRRIGEIESESKRLRDELLVLPKGDTERIRRENQLTLLRVEDSRIIRDIEEWFRSEQDFFRFLLDHKLAPVPGAEALWGAILREKIALMGRVLARKTMLRPLSAKGFSFLEYYADLLANAGNLRLCLESEGMEPALCETLRMFLDEENTQPT